MNDLKENIEKYREAMNKAREYDAKKHEEYEKVDALARDIKKNIKSFSPLVFTSHIDDTFFIEGTLKNPVFELLSRYGIKYKVITNENYEPMIKFKL